MPLQKETDCKTEDWFVEIRSQTWINWLVHSKHEKVEFNVINISDTIWTFWVVIAYFIGWGFRPKILGIWVINLAFFSNKLENGWSEGYRRNEDEHKELQFPELVSDVQEFKKCPLLVLLCDHFSWLDVCLWLQATISVTFKCSFTQFVGCYWVVAANADHIKCHEEIGTPGDRNVHNECIVEKMTIGGQCVEGWPPLNPLIWKEEWFVPNVLISLLDVQLRIVVLPPESVILIGFLFNLTIFLYSSIHQLLLLNLFFFFAQFIIFSTLFVHEQPCVILLRQAFIRFRCLHFGVEVAGQV